ncbi:glucosamine inositolphosphorylceramide transferase family protein [Acetobacter conturbans]|uniref:Glucosamine inositolphosphorylceramide transferase 1 N-terminal domain-containing protein n=1 Tax=Acetobacter conturbans TaxID=1737472 RepID=A0ABX0K4K0_9PROT|nr:hypothetical protein [Acetobacter conturbans]NHN89578.1 hypothetical protein [Acetobacter conturbans]
MSIFKTDIWRTGIVNASMSQIRDTGSLEPFSIRWLPNPTSFCFMADPFGLWRDGRLHVFVETYDYRTRKGVIDVLILNEAFELHDQRTVLSEPWHLSYPFVFEAEGETWMLPEAYRSGRLTLYRAKSFPWEWEPVPAFHFPHAAIDATPVFTDGAWWMFYSPSEPQADRIAALRLARADTLTGEWQDVGALPIRRGREGSRMGGTPLMEDGIVTLPMQDCTETYGGALQLLTTTLPLTSEPVFQTGPRLTPPTSAAPFTQGLHTLSAAGHVTLIDTKRILRNAPARLAVDLRHRFSRS